LAGVTSLSQNTGRGEVNDFSKTDMGEGVVNRARDKQKGVRSSSGVFLQRRGEPKEEETARISWNGEKKASRPKGIFRVRKESDSKKNLFWIWS